MKMLGSLGLLLFIACTVPQPPVQPPTPPVNQHQPVCHSTPGLVKECWHNPPEGWLYVCIVYDAAGKEIGLENKTDKAQCMAKPSGPTYIPDDDLVSPAVPEDPFKSKTWDVAWAAVNRWRSAHPEAWRGDGACLINNAAGIDAAYDAIGSELARVGVTAAQSITRWGQKSDCIFVNRAGTNLYEEIHLFEYGGGCVGTTPATVKGLWQRGTAPATPPPVTPPPVTPPPVTPPTTGLTCPAPVPPKVMVAEEAPGWGIPPEGWPHYEISCRPHGALVDCTPVLLRACYVPQPSGPVLNFCAAIGLGEYNGAIRCTCPVRPDGHPERVQCERYLLGGDPVLDSRNGAVCARKNDNLFQFEPNGGNCRLCDAAKNVCGGWF